MHRIVITLSLLLGLGGPALGGPVLPRQVDAKAKWFLHVDLEAIRAVPQVEEGIKRLMENPHARGRIDRLVGEIGFNPLEDLLDVTVYGTRYADDAGVAILHVRRLNVGKIVEFLRAKHPEHKVTEHSGHKLMTWPQQIHGKTLALTATLFESDLILFGAEAEPVKAALDVLERKKPGLDDSAALFAGLDRKATVLARAPAVPPDYQKVTRCPVLRSCTSATVQWLVDSQRVEGRYELIADSPETAKNLEKVVDGFKALGNLRYRDLPAVEKVVAGLTYRADGQRFVVTWKTTPEDIRAGVKAVLQQRKKG